MPSAAVGFLFSFLAISCSASGQTTTNNVARSLRARITFAADRSIEGLMRGFGESPGLAKFFAEVRTLLAENPGIISLVDVPETVAAVQNLQPTSALPMELGLALLHRWDAPVSRDAVSGVPLRDCFSEGATVAVDDRKDLVGLLQYAANLDHFQSYIRRPRGPVWSTLRREWLGLQAQIPSSLLAEFQSALTQYRACMLVMAYDADACGSTDAQRAAHMDAENVHELLENFLPQLREATGAVAGAPALQYGKFVQLTGVSSPQYAGRVCVVTGPETPNSRQEISTGVACLIKGKWSTVRIVLSKLTLLPRPDVLADEDNAGVSLELLTTRLYSITTYPDGFLNDPVNEAQARLIGLVADHYFGFHGLVKLAEAKRGYTRHLEHVFNYIGDFLA